MNICFCFYSKFARDVVTVLLILVDIYYCSYTFSHAHIEAHTHKHTCMSSTQEEWRQPGTGGAKEGVFVRDKDLAHTNTHTHTHTHAK